MLRPHCFLWPDYPHQLTAAGKWIGPSRWRAGVAVCDGFDREVSLARPNWPSMSFLCFQERGREGEWFGVIMSVFLIGAATGGVLFGWLGDRLGRVRAMALSIATYAVFTGLCGFAGAAWHIAVLRFIASLGMGGEWALGVALVTEVWPDRSRAFLAGLIGAAANVGILLVGLLSLILVSFIDGVRELFTNVGVPQSTVAYLLHGDGWRLMMMAGALPAFFVFVIRQFVPESRKWEVERDRGGTSHWATRDLLGVLLGGIAAATVIFLWSPVFDAFFPSGSGDFGVFLTNHVRMLLRINGTWVGLVVALVGYMFPVLRYLPGRGGRCAGRRGSPPIHRSHAARRGSRRSGSAGNLGIAAVGTEMGHRPCRTAPQRWGPLSRQRVHANFDGLGGDRRHTPRPLGAGRIGRRITYAMLCIASFVSLIYMYQGNTAFDAKMLVSVFVAGRPRPRSMVGSHYIFPNSFQPAFAPLARASPITSAVSCRRLARSKPPR